MMLSAMNAVTIWAIEQSISPNAVKTGETSSEKANSNLKTNSGIEADERIKPKDYVLLASNKTNNNGFPPTPKTYSGVVELLKEISEWCAENPSCVKYFNKILNSPPGSGPPVLKEIGRILKEWWNSPVPSSDIKIDKPVTCVRPDMCIIM